MSYCKREKVGNKELNVKCEVIEYTMYIDFNKLKINSISHRTLKNLLEMYS